MVIIMLRIKFISLLSVIKNNYIQFYQYTKTDNKLSLLGMLTISIVVFSNTAMIWMMGTTINQIQLGLYDGLFQLLIIFAIVIVVNQSMQMTGSWIINELCLRFIGRCRNALLAHSLNLSFPLISKMTKGDIMARLSNDIDMISQVIVTGRMMLVSHVLTLGIYITMIFWINSALALFAISTIPLYWIHQRYFSPRKQRATKAFLDKNAQLVSYEEQSLSGLRGISSNTAEFKISKNHNSLFHNTKIFAIKERLLESGFSISFMLLNYLVGLFIIFIGVSSIQQGALTVGHLLSFILYLGYLTIPVRGMTEIFLECTGNIAAANRVSELFNTESTTKDRDTAKELHISSGTIEFIGIDFLYADDKPIFTNVNVHIEGKNSYALVGPSGAGKSSFVNLLMRFYNPQHGCIKIDGVDIRDVSLQSLRSKIAVVWQDNFYINDTIRENLLIANPSATTKQIIKACVDANAWQFIQQFSDGLDTRLGSNGVSLSGGQNQRIAIAQAFLKNAPIIVFDEASSALDSQSEQQIMSSLGTLFSDRTILTIAHRYSSIKNANQVIYFYSDGRITMGKHDELYDQIEDYRDAVTWQTSLKAG